ncbi:hypothetical protein PFISCL1PPCAC_19175, partial [Pristionchus fissidentatus]
PPIKRLKEDNEQTNLMDLPDEILSMIITHLDLPSRLKFRVNRRLDRIELATKNQIDELIFKGTDDSFCVIVKELNGLESIDVDDQEMEDLEEGLKRIAMNTNCNTIDFNTIRDVDKDCFELIRLVTSISAQSIKIYPNSMNSVDQAINRLRPSFDLLDYNFILSICENSKKVDVEFECDSLCVQEWIQIRQKMLSREISLTYLDVFIDETIASSILFA